MDNETGTRRRRFLKQASLLVAGAQAGVLLPFAFASAAAIPGAAGQAKPSSAAAGSDLVVDTSSGKVRGTVQDRIRVFKGIPYGASPVGNNRFMPPKKPVSWRGVRPATAFGHDAPQVPLGNYYDYVRIIDWVTFPGGAGGRLPRVECLDPCGEGQRKASRARFVPRWRLRNRDGGKHPV